MKKTDTPLRSNSTVCLLALAAVLMCVSWTGAQDTNRASFNDDWRFLKNDPARTEGVLTGDNVKDWVSATGNAYVVDGPKPARPTGSLGENVPYTRSSFDDSSWRQLNLPHDWGIEGDFQQALPGDIGKRPFIGVGWYRKHFNVTKSDTDKQIFIDFDGAMSHSTVWLNGKFVGGWPYGYASFRLDLTPFLEYGKENVIAVRLDNPPESSRWYPGSGIYRNVSLIKTATLHVGSNGTYITTPDVSKVAASVKIRVAVNDELAVPVHVDVKTSVYRTINGMRSGSPVATTISSGVDVPAKGSKDAEAVIKIANPDLWRPTSPKLYVAETQIMQNGKVVDTYETNFGIRTIKFDTEKGLLVNGEHVYVKGVCDHHDLGALGSAINVRALERQIEILKSFGVNAIRT
ncbi:MAG: sugar-binding domain-containing protein, partial [Acidobacteriota bacterium]